MGKEEMKPEVNKPGEGKPAGEAEQPQEAAKTNTGEDKPQKPIGGESKESKDAPPPPPPPPPPALILLKVNMHCEGCARKVRRCLRHLEGVEDVQTDCKAQKVVVKGERADPVRVLERLQRKSHLQVDLLSPIPKPPSKDPEKEDEKVNPKPMEEKEAPPPPPITVVLRVHMHCEACAHEIQKRIKKMKGVSSAEPDLKSSRVAVKGIFDPAKLVEFVYKRTGKHAIVVEKDASEKEEVGDGKGKDEAAEGGGSAGDAADKKGAEAVDGQGTKEVDGSSSDADSEGAPLLNASRSEYSTYPLPPHFYHREPLYYSPLESYSPPALMPMPPLDAYHLLPYASQPPPPSQMFSDENPNACYVM